MPIADLTGIGLTSQITLRFEDVSGLEVGDWVYQSLTDPETLVRAVDNDTAPVIGIIDRLAGTVAEVLLLGVATSGLSGLAPGRIVFLSSTGEATTDYSQVGLSNWRQVL